MSIAMEVAVRDLKERVAVLEAGNRQLMTRVSDLESEIEAVKSAPAIASDISSRPNAAPKKR
jgi:hypothetical protein